MSENLCYKEVYKFPFIRLCFFYIDTPGHLADVIFQKHRIPVRYLTDISMKGEDYLLVGCTVPRRHRQRFMEVMRELRNHMLICGHTDYDEKSQYIKKAFFTLRGGKQDAQMFVRLS